MMQAGFGKNRVISIEFGSLRHKLLIYIYIHMSLVFHSFLCFFYGSFHFDAVVLLKFNHLTGASEKTAEASEDS